MSIHGPRRIIDSRNGGTSCLRCRHYEEVHNRHDPMFGLLTEHGWCAKKDRKITTTLEGQDCPFYLKTVYNIEKKG